MSNTSFENIGIVFYINRLETCKFTIKIGQFY